MIGRLNRAKQSGEVIPDYEFMITEVREDDTIKYDIKFNKVQS